MDISLIDIAGFPLSFVREMQMLAPLHIALNQINDKENSLGHLQHNLVLILAPRIEDNQDKQ